MYCGPMENREPVCIVDTDQRSGDLVVVQSVIRIGDWVQAREVIHKYGDEGEIIGTLAKKGAVGHVMWIDADYGPECIGYTVTFERNGRTSTVGANQLLRLCDYRGVP